MRGVYGWNWHSPYWAMWARALPEVRVALSPTSHAPGGWRIDQRPQPANVYVMPHAADSRDVVVIQTAADLAVCERGGWSGPFVVIAHNRAEFEEPRYVSEICRMARDFPLVAISEMKAQSWRDAGYAHPITVIPPYVDPDDYGGWTGEGGYVLTVANNLRRPLFDLDAWLQATEGLPVRLVGSGNEGIPGAVGPAKDWEELKRYYREARVYLSPTKAPAEDAHNLSMLEAAAAGCPVLSWHQNAPWCAARGITNDTLRGLLDHSDEKERQIERDAGQLAKQWVEREFPLPAFRDKWRQVLEEITK